MIAHAPAFIVAGPLLFAMLAPLVALRTIRGLRALAVLILAATLGLSVSLLIDSIVAGPIHYHFGGWAPPFGIEFVIDPLSGLMAVLVSFFAVLTVFGLEPETKKMSNLAAGSFYALFLLLVAGLIGISVTGDLFNLYVFLEISALSSYALVACGGDRAKVAAFRYLILGSVGATLWVLGLGYLYGVTGTLNMADMGRLLPAVYSSRAVVCGLALILAGILVKMAVFPLHGWQPDAYSYAPASVIPFISSVMSKVAAYVLLRVLYSIFAARGPAASALEILGGLAALSIVAGSLLALAQKDIRRMLAYSSVAQIGYILMGFSLGGALAMTGAILHLIYHAIMKGCMFLCVAGFRCRTGKVNISDLAGLGTHMPWTSAAFTMAAISMIGLPPTCGFFSKFYLATGAVRAGEWYFIGALVISSLLSTLYFFRVIEQLYLRPSKLESPPKEEAPSYYLLPALLLAGLTLALGLSNQALVDGVVFFALPGGAG